MSRPALQFPFDSEFDFSFRPDSYWPQTPTEETVLAGIKGTARRDVARRALEGEELVRLGDDALYEGAMEFVLQEELSEAERQSWGSIHPAMMGGEYLPGMEPQEVEIARVDLQSTTADAIQIRARPDKDGIHYRVVDEYEADGSRYELEHPTSERPLSLGQLIDLIDTARQPEGSYLHSGDDRYDIGLVDSVRDMNADNGSDLETMRYFVSVSSAFYPTLTDYYEKRADAWLEAAGAAEE